MASIYMPLNYLQPLFLHKSVLVQEVAKGDIWIYCQENLGNFSKGKLLIYKKSYNFSKDSIFKLSEFLKSLLGF